jgi:hypothetical protein
MAIARAKGKLRGKQPKLSEKQQKELTRMHATGDYSISDLAELFAVSTRLIHRTLLGWRRLAVSRPETSSLWGSELGLEMVGGVIAP